MATVTRELPSFQNVAPGAKATCSLPVTKTYEGLFLRLQDTNGLMSEADQESYINKVVLRAGGPKFGQIDLWNLTGAQLIALNNYYGITHSSGVLPLTFGAPYWNNPAVQDLHRLGTLDLDSLTLEITLASGVSAPQIEGISVDVAGANSPLGEFVKLNTNSIQVSSTGEKEVPDLPVTGDFLGLKALHVATGGIDDAQVEANNEIIYEDFPEVRPDIADHKAFRTGGRSPQSGYTHLDFAGNDPNNIFNTTGWQDFRIKLDMTTTGGFDVIHETVIGRFQPDNQ